MTRELTFRDFVEARGRTRTVYHADHESEWGKVMRRQRDHLYVAPNLGTALNWAGWVVAGQEHEGRMTFYLHRLAIPEWLYRDLAERQRGKLSTPIDPRRQDATTNNVTELLVPPEYWSLVRHEGAKKFLRSDILRLAARQRNAEAQIERRPHHEE